MKVCFKCGSGVPEELYNLKLSSPRSQQAILAKLLESEGKILPYAVFDKGYRCLHVHVSLIRKAMRDQRVRYFIETTIGVGLRLVRLIDDSRHDHDKVSYKLGASCPNRPVQLSRASRICLHCGRGIPDEMRGLGLTSYQNYLLTRMLECVGEVVPYSSLKNTRAGRPPQRLYLQVRAIRNSLRDVGSDYLVVMHENGVKLKRRTDRHYAGTSSYVVT